MQVEAWNQADAWYFQSPALLTQPLPTLALCQVSRLPEQRISHLCILYPTSHRQEAEAPQACAARAHPHPPADPQGWGEPTPIALRSQLKCAPTWTYCVLRSQASAAVRAPQCLVFRTGSQPMGSRPGKAIRMMLASPFAGIDSLR